MSEVRFANVSNPAAFGVEWSAGENGNRYQLVNPRDTDGLIFGMKVEGAHQWSVVPVVDPTRFMDTAPKNFRSFLEVARAYVA
ncbi:MAG: hypothetical protein ABIQ18_21530 [Umezawaea sp.]